MSATLRNSANTHLSFVWNEPEENALAIDYKWHSIVAEYLDDGEKSELLAGLRDAGFAVTVYDGERASLRAVLNGDWRAIPYSDKYVFNTTGSGTGRARTSLVPAFCDLCQIPICSADGLTAALLENKFYTFRLLESLNFPVPESWLYDLQYGWRNGAPESGVRVICKPCCESSSIGIDEQNVFSYDDSKLDFLQRMSSAFRQPILVQTFIPGYEVEVPVFPYPRATCPAAVGIETSKQRLLGEAILTNDIVLGGNYEFYDFSDPFPSCAEALKLTAEAAYAALGLSGLARVDFRVTLGQQIFITDFNTPPHLTDHSSCSFSFRSAGLRHSDLMAALVTIGRFNSASLSEARPNLDIT
ncbi:hypothetical protein [Bradyrhizobium sp. Ec3.3]|uniref:hypothetical protein n=1 Tax=Bradyrhizobium sp. Ec3.3 TaxID=189753 RepID=UPI0018DDE931|nr:hypothetical protein [Bradyrhizobium sp. Ec3.3]